jgi:type I restriction enzyme S subunit
MSNGKEISTHKFGKSFSLPKDWKFVSISEFGRVITGSTPSMNDLTNYGDEVPWCTTVDMKDKYVARTRIYLSAKGANIARIVPKGAILVTCIGTIGKIAIAAVDLATNQQINSIVVDNNVNNEYLYYAISNYVPKMQIIAGKTSVPIINKSTFENFCLPCPPISMQLKIAQILTTWDRAIEQVQRLIEAKQRQKNQLVSRLLSGQMRFPGFQDEWKQVNLGAFLHPKFRKVVKPVGAYLRLGIRSHGKGTFTSVVDDPETIALTHLFQARKDDLIVNITFAWEGAIALVGPDGDGALVSHRFPTYVFDTSKMLPEYFKHLMVTDRFFYDLDLISPGGAGRNRVMNKGDFLKITVTIPGVEEQKKIAGVLGGMDEQIALLKKYLGKLQKQKNGLMQKLLTGEIRVKVN